MAGNQVNNIDLIKRKVEVSFQTKNTSDNSIFSEVHTISGPTGTNIAPITNAELGPYKLIVPLSNATGNGAPALKIWIPDPNNFPSKMYITYCVKNANMNDGYYDYTQDGLPSTYKTALSNWIAGNPLQVPSGVKTRDLNFTVWGLDTNQQQQAKPFIVRFRWDFGGTVSQSA
jgi:hypothetical protein